jgi:Ser/Thr protein kinase RdoA (MazF antagonist)
MSADDESIRALVAEAGWFADCTATPIGGTGNNAVFRLEAAGQRYVLKRYFQHPGDPRDRFATERAFATFLWKAGLRWTPEPLRWDAERRLGLFEHIPGSRPERATPELIDSALHFFLEANAHRTGEAAGSLPLASEACFSIAEHLDRVARRVERLRQIPVDTEIAAHAAALVARELTPAWQSILSRARGSVESSAPADQPLAPSERCLSPSDFGFHNALVTPDGRVRFLDFEYAGWDDPAKTVCDFFCQPAVPVPLAHLDEFRSRLAAFDGPALRRRVSTLLPVYRIKWCCIMLNEFQPVGESRRAFAQPGADRSSRQRAQLAKVRRLLEAVNG